MRIPKTIFVAIFVLTASVGVVFGLIASLQDDLGFKNGILGLIAAAAFFSAVLAQLFLAPLADRGFTKALMITAISVAALGCLWFALASSALELILARTLTGLGIGAFAPAARAVVANADTSRSGERLGRLAAVETSGFVAGPVIGALLNEIWGLKAPFLVFSFVLLCLLPSLLRIQLAGASSTATPFKLILHDLSCDVEKRGSYSFGRRSFLSRRDVEAIWARFMEDLGASTLFVGVSLTMYGIHSLL